MKISSCQSINKFSSYNSMSSMETIDSPVQVFDKSKKMISRPLLNKIISKEDLRQFIAQDSISSKNSLRRLDSYNLSDNGSSCGNVKSDRHIVIPVKARNFAFEQSQKKEISQYASAAAPSQEVYLDSSADVEPMHNSPQQHPSQYSHYAAQQSIFCLDNEYDSESDSDEHNIWDNSDPQEMGIEMDNSDVPFEFCQLFYIRSQLYQANKINKSNILEEVQVISNMCKKEMNVLRSNKLMDLIEKKYHLSMKKNALQISKLKIQKSRLATPTMANQGVSTSLKQTPKAFRISQYPLFSTPNKLSIKQSSQTNIPENIVSPIYSNGRQLLAKSTTNFRLSSNETASYKESSPQQLYDSRNNAPISSIKKVKLQLSASQSRNDCKILDKYEILNKQNLCINNLGRTVKGHSKFYQSSQIKI